MVPATRSQTSPKTANSTTSSKRSTTSTSSSPITKSSNAFSSSRKSTIIILGTGWAGWTLAQELSSSPISKMHTIIVLSPSRTMALTPLLASAACGIFDFRIAEEPVRRLGNAGRIQKYQVHVSSVDLDGKKVRCEAAVGSNGDARLAVDFPFSEEETGGSDGEFELGYDKLILAPGSETNTFGTPGVLEHCLMMKSVKDAMLLREKILDCFELASLPIYSLSRKKEILHFIIIGGGPTGVELAAEIDELVHNHLLRIYPELEGLAMISVYDVAERMLGQFGENLSEYAMEKFRKRNVKICMERHIEGFERGIMRVKEDGEVRFGAAVWCAGNKACRLVEELDVRKSDGGMERILTDRWMRVLKPEERGKNGEEEEFLDGVYALGDAADIDGDSLPSTAEVAVQKAKWLAQHLTDVDKGEGDERKDGFKYGQKALVAYIGRQDGVVEGKSEWTGKSAWLAWRSGSLEWTRSWRRRAMILLVWVMNKLDGREIARR